MTLEQLRGKKVAVVGLGVNNAGLSEFFFKHDVPHVIIDHWKFVGDLSGRLKNYDVIFRTPGLPYLSKPVQEALDSGTIVYSQTKLFFDLCPAKIIGVTGTKGKGTVATLISEILTASSKKNWLAGNVGRDPFEFLDQIKSQDFVVLELSSFQLQDLEKSPHIAVVLAISPDHLNYHDNFEEYLEAKSNIMKHQSSEDIAVLSRDSPAQFKNLGRGQKFFFDPNNVAGFERKLLGSHNLQNIAAAFQTAKVLGVNERIIRKSVAELEPLPHRLKIVAKINGVTFVDDAYATNIGPTLAAVDAFTKPIILIVGGHDKGLDFSELGKKIKSASHLKGLVVIGQVADKIIRKIKGYSGKIFTGAKNMTEILQQAGSIAQKGDVVLFSPATSSFDMFKNEADRGEQFVRAVRNLKNESR